MKSRMESPVQPEAPAELEHLRGLFEELDLKIEDINPDIVRKLLLLDEKTETFRDEERSIHLAKALFEYYENQKPEAQFTDEEKRTVLVGTMFTDIGKAGPREATPTQEQIILEIYNIENVFNPYQTTIEQLLTEHFPENAGEKLAALSELGINGEMTMREFYNLHAEWTLGIISGDGVPPEAVVAAATHHLLEGINPESIVGPGGKFTKYFGDNAYFDRPEKLIIILDKYDALRRRGGKDHREAVEALRKIVDSNPTFKGDAEFAELIEGLDAFLTTNEEAYEDKNLFDKHSHVGV